MKQIKSEKSIGKNIKIFNNNITIWTCNKIYRELLAEGKYAIYKPLKL